MVMVLLVVLAATVGRALGSSPLTVPEPAVPPELL
jgi:hypothetical protein